MLCGGLTCWLAEVLGASRLPLVMLGGGGLCESGGSGGSGGGSGELRAHRAFALEGRNIWCISKLFHPSLYN